MNKIYIGTTNIVKISAADEVLQPLGYQVQSCVVQTGVSSQPKSDDETIKGAYNRAKSIPYEGLKLGLEAGIETTEVIDELGKNVTFLTNWGVLIDENDKVYIAGGTRIPLPDEIVGSLFNDGYELSDAMNKYFDTIDIKHKEGAVGYFTSNLVKRKDIFVHIVKLLYGQYLKERDK